MVRSQRSSAPRGRGDQVRSEKLIGWSVLGQIGAARPAAFRANPGVNLDPRLGDLAGRPLAYEGQRSGRDSPTPTTPIPEPAVMALTMSGELTTPWG